MKCRAGALLLLLTWCGCRPAEESHAKAILGAVLIDGNGGPPLTDSVIVVAGERIRAAGARSAVPIPAEADKINGGGKFVVPLPVDLWDRPDPAGMIRPANAAQARAQVAELAGRKAAAIHLGPAPGEAADAVLEEARAAGIPVFAHISTLTEVERLVEGGAPAFVGMIRDTEAIGPDFLLRLRALRVVFAPALSGSGAALETAKRNTLRLFQAGVPIAVASGGHGVQQEMELLASAGIPPLDVIVAAARNGAAALRLPDRGTIEPGKSADLLLVSANPGEDIAHLRHLALRMTAGAWVK